MQKRTTPTRLLLPVVLVLSLRILEATPVNGAPSSFDHTALPSGREEVTDKTEVDPAVAKLVDVRLSGNAALRGLWLPGKEFVREWGGGNTNWPAIDEGGDFGSEVRRLPGRPDMESRWWFFTNVGVKSGPSSNDRNREDSKDSSSSSWKLGEVRYLAVRLRVPIG